MVVFLSDNGSQFTGRELGRYLREIGVRQQFTAPYCPQENPTERANRTLKTMMAQVRWDCRDTFGWAWRYGYLVNSTNVSWKSVDAPIDC